MARRTSRIVIVDSDSESEIQSNKPKSIDKQSDDEFVPSDDDHVVLSESDGHSLDDIASSSLDQEEEEEEEKEEEENTPSLIDSPATISDSDEPTGFVCGSQPFINLSNGSSKSFENAQTPMKSVSKRIPSIGAKRQMTLDTMFGFKSKSPKRELVELTNFIDTSDDDLKTSSSKRPKPAPRKSSSSTVSTGKGFKSTFSAKRRFVKMDFVPPPAKVAEHKSQALEKNKQSLFPPIHDLADIFMDMIQRAPGIEQLAKTLESRPLRVATMCSGTESPLLALQLMTRAIKEKYGIQIQIHHVFSCEIEPFKQAYIERNFSPPILFRDVTELGGDKAHTAYGALVNVPGNVDLLVAGTSCVDYSHLNNKKKGLNDGGESGRTFHGMLEWVKRHKPALVLLENVKNAPWVGVAETIVQRAGYDVGFSNMFDTKNYYIPHTRQRGYLLATRNTTDCLPENWELLTNWLIRPASSPLDAFLLPTDDPRIQHVRQQFAHGQGLSRGRSTIDWSKCQSRHERARDEEELGKTRPLTAWEEGGTCKMSHDGWNEWAIRQPERVTDLMDITTLRFAVMGQDPIYKSKIWELSQNVDRNVAASRPGVAPCLTPSGIPFLTSRGGPLIGLEALSLQGLPLDELLLTRESDDQLQDLAGNAMSSTVVGACVLSALLAGMNDFAKTATATATAAATDSNLDEKLDKDKEEMLKSTDVVEAVADEISTIVGQEMLEQADLDLTSSVRVTMQELLKAAVNSSQFCNCEGRTMVTSRQIYRCTLCDHTACESCKGRPVHNLNVDTHHRRDPQQFAPMLKAALPMRLHTTGIPIESIKTLASQTNGFKNHSLAMRWCERVGKVLDQSEFRFQDLLRKRVWQARFVAPSARLDLILDPIEPHWRIFVDPEADEPAGSPPRALLIQPVARMALDPLATHSSLLDGKWEICLPTHHSANITITCKGEKVPTWESAMGLAGKFTDNKRFNQLHVSVPDDTIKYLDNDIRGTYDLLEQCGTACGALHVRRGDENTNKTRKLYLFIDTDRFKDQSGDRFVFSTDTSPWPYPLERVSVGRLPDGWRPKMPKRDEVEVVENVELQIAGLWKTLDSFQIAPGQGVDGKIKVPCKPVEVDLRKQGCEVALAVMACEAPVPKNETGRIWPSGGGWGQVDLLHKTNTTFSHLAWLVERVPDIKAFEQWMSASHDVLNHATANCSKCAPAEPDIQWLLMPGKPVIPIENTMQAGPYEQALKNRPSPFVMHLRLHNGLAQIQFGLNAATLMHRALSRLPPILHSGQVELSWRLSKMDKSLDMFSLPKYTIMSNRGDVEAPTPALFALELRKEQKRSLTWMIEQERDEMEPFFEEEISEGLLTPLGWRAEGRATRPILVRGGVLADAVGYGKTAISLALIASSRYRTELPPLPAADQDAYISTKATLVIVPGHLCKQWQKEVSKFCPKKLSVRVITSKLELNKLSVKEVLESDIIIMSVTVYKSDAYWETLARISAANPLPNKAGRFFNAALKRSLAALRNRVKELKSDDGKEIRKLSDSIKNRADFDNSHITTHKARKRLIGKAYADAHKEDKDKFKVDSDEEADQEMENVKELQSSAKKEADPWSLGSSAVQRDWTKMTCPPLEMFMWNRVIVDEFHYIAESMDRTLAGVTSLQARSKWILSGTPPTADFADVKSIAVFLNIHLGVDDDADTTKDSVRKAREKNRTAAEKFNNFREMHSPAWHHRRQQVAQRFLDRFVRSNEPEIGELPTQQLIKPIRLPAAESALYLELAHAIENLDLRHQRKVFKGRPKAKTLASAEPATKRKLGDPNLELSHRDQRLIDTLGNSASPEEALLKRASVYDDFAGVDLDALKGVSNAIKACEFIVRERKKQLKDCKDQLERELPLALEQHLLVLHHFGFRDENRQFFADFVRNANNAAWGDHESKQMVKEILERAHCTMTSITLQAAKQHFGRAGKLKETLKRREKERAAAEKGGGGGGGDGDGDGKKPAKTSDKELAWTEEYHLRQMVHQLTRLRNELVGRVNALRFFTMIRDCQRAHLEGVKVKIVCPAKGCKHEGKHLTLGDVSITSTCGHSGCRDCVLHEAYIGKCPTEGCAALAKPTSIVQASSLGAEDDGNATRYGTKLALLCSLLKRIPKTERALVFVQFDTLTATVAEALREYGISFVQLTGSAKRRSDLLEAYQDEMGARVLLLNIEDESAAGSNLTVANHVIFVGPLLKQEQQQYDATMTQAIGRCVRYGQVKKVFVWRLAAMETIDQEILEKRDSLTLDEQVCRTCEQEFDNVVGGTLVLQDVEKQTTIKKRKRSGDQKDDDDEAEAEAEAKEDEEKEGHRRNRRKTVTASATKSRARLSGRGSLSKPLLIDDDEE